MDDVFLAGLLKIELPGHTVLLCDGGTIPHAGDTYISIDPLFGVLKSIDTIEEGVDEQAPAFTLKFAPPDDAAAADLISQNYQGARLRLWIAELDAAAAPNLVEQMADMVIDVPQLRFPSRGGRVLEISCVSVWQRLFDTDEGNLLNGPAHKRIFAGELGLDNTTGVNRNVPWGTNSVRTGN